MIYLAELFCPLSQLLHGLPSLRRVLKPVTAVVALARGLLGRRLELGDGFSLTDAEASLAEKGVQIEGLRIVD